MSQNPFEALGGGGFDMNALLQQAQQMQEQLASAQARLAETTVDGTVAGGAVTVTVNGVASADDIHKGNGGPNAINGTAGADFIDLSQGGDDDADGGGGNDVFLFGASLTSADAVDGGTGTDQLALQGDYSGGVTLGSGVIGIESLVLLAGNDIRFGDPGTNFYDYDLTMVDQNVGSGQTLTIDGSRLRAGEDFIFDGSAETDGGFYVGAGNGANDLTGGARTDVFLFAPQVSFGADDVLHGGGAIDQLALRGNFTIAFTATQLDSIENIVLLSGRDIRANVDYQYSLTMNDGNVGAGSNMVVDAAQLKAGETLTFDGSAESDGFFRMSGGAGADTIIGSQNGDTINGKAGNDHITGAGGNDRLTGAGGADTLTGGTGNDSFIYTLKTDSTAAATDLVTDFTAGDILDLGSIDAKESLAGNQAFSFIGSGAFTNSAGQLRAEEVSTDHWLVQGDVNGDGNADLVIFVDTTGGHDLVATDFVL